MSYEILKKHKDLINHYHIAESLGNGWGGALEEIKAAIMPDVNLYCGPCADDMLKTAWNMLQKFEAEEKKNISSADLRQAFQEKQNTNGNQKTESAKKAGRPKKK